MLDELKIKRADNGFIIKYRDEDYNEIEKNILFEIKGTEKLECYKEILYEILVWMGYFISKHDSEILEIKIINNLDKI